MKSKTILVAIWAAVMIFASATMALAPAVKADTGFFDMSFLTEAVAKEPAKPKFGPRAIECLALNIYHESRGSNLADKAAVADVVLNRKNDRRYPDSVCGVVEQSKLDRAGLPKKNQCQFSWFCDGRSDTPTDKDRWEEAKLIAHQMLIDGKYRGISEGATHYHATYVNPSWAKAFQQVGRIGEHVFYRWE